MPTIYVDFNDLARPGCVVVHAQMQPDGQLPTVHPGTHVLVREYGDDDAFEAVIAQDTTGALLADMDAARFGSAASSAAATHS
jgi:hypothetical protein